ncbi:phosphate ABC transporter permease subunit PstC [Polymorphum gilvum]|uniref:Phosphate transport system permease protein n=1 Tax=Polymorphum gilvum (strain LMG 25793 / CGMCC 1.9160 / SL003B-26A1) TaxID=991905 RepID=F2IY89_POLGS|nr:phosphate ABC transporter permease subunit PstC [Polymorphum gilvum]ADZ71701.1 phosphate ABC transporter permease protein [Polymorphum gilvum SL003B-26A1]
MASTVFFILLILAVLGYVAGLFRAKVVRGTAYREFHSLPIYHGLNIAIWTGVPALIIVLMWLLFQGAAVDRIILNSLGTEVTSLDAAQQALLLSEIKQVAAGRIFREPTGEIRAAADFYNAVVANAQWAMLVVAISIALIGFGVGYRMVAVRFRARHSVERSLNYFMIFCSVVAIATTAGIIVSLLYEALQFFARVPVAEFFFGLNWEPQIPMREDQVAGAGAFGAVPVFLGTLVIAVIAMAVATPIGLFSAVYLTEFASNSARAIIKPLLEILAGIPTVVYGFFAVLTVAPALRGLGDWMGIGVSPNAALVAGGVMGIMLIPFISSLSDDALTAVPRAVRDGSLALGATKGETIRKVLLPAALPGIVGGILLALSRAIGETMIVVMAAGLIASLNVNPLQSVTTVTVQIVTLLIGDTSFDNPKTLAAFALGLVLFVITLALNVVALRIVRKYREQY